jgi:SpoVK/Ycf46/Vps4 family AAA+-type ATPase
MTGGRKLQIPFDLFVVFATNLDPASVIEEAFLRRIQTKINMGKLTSQQFHEIFKRACTSSSLKYDKDLVDDVMKRIVDEFEQPLRACQPQDLINQILWRAKYEQTQPAFDVQGLAAACRAYFLTKPEP